MYTLNYLTTTRRVIVSHESQWNNFANYFFSVNNTAFVNFFSANYLTIPKKLQKSYSLRRNSARIPLLKFINLVTKRGLFNKINTIIVRLFHKLSSILSIVAYNVDLVTSNTVFLITNLVLNYHLTTQYRHFKKENDFWFFLLYLVTSVNPLFAFYLNRVDKKVRKFSRGKSGKYKVVFKYVPEYKRQTLVMRLLVKEVKFSTQHTLSRRLEAILRRFITSPAKSLPARIARFSHYHAFNSAPHQLLRLSKNI